MKKNGGLNRRLMNKTQRQIVLHGVNTQKRIKKKAVIISRIERNGNSGAFENEQHQREV